MQFYFAYLTDGDESYMAADLDRHDEVVMDLTISQAEGEFATAKVSIMANASSHYNSLGRRACISARFDAGEPIVPLIVGTITAIPRALRGQTVELELLAQRADWEELRDALIDSLAVAPYFDPLFVPADQVRKRRLRPTGFQLDGLKFQGSRSSMADWG